MCCQLAAMTHTITCRHFMPFVIALWHANMPKTSREKFRSRAYITPALPPENQFVYFCVPVPNNDQNIENFLGAVQTLTLWTNYERTEDKRGKQIADIWREIWLNLVYSEDDCMSPCCPEELENQETIIYQSYVQNYNSWVANNQNVSIQNNQYYDGNPQSIFAGAGANFETSGDGVLCAAIEAYINNLCYMHASRAAIGSAAAAGIVSAIALLLAAGTFGISVAVGIAVSAAIGVSAAAWRSILQDPEALRDVRCCMYDNLNGAALTYENFQTSLEGCGFTGANNNAILAGTLANDTANYPENFTAFLRSMSQAASDDTTPCECGCEEGEFELVAVNNCTVTAVEGEPTKWRVQQADFVVEGVDPHRIYLATFKDVYDRCFNIIGAEGTSQSAWGLTNCSGVNSEGTGGIGGEMILAKTYARQQITTTVIPIDIIFELECPS